MNRFWICGILLLSGCGTVQRFNTSTLQRSNSSTAAVPFIAQEPNACGPAALAMIAQFYGRAVTPEEIGHSIYLPDIHGTLTSDLVNYGQRLNLWTRQYRGSRGELRQKVSAGVPMVVLGKLGANYHYFVVLDDRDGEMIVHSDTRPFLRLREEDFLRWWERAGRWTLLVCPAEQVRWRMSAEEYNDLGVFLERSGQLEAASRNYRRATELEPGRSYFYVNLGNAMLKQRQFREAIAAYKNAVHASANNADALNNLACAYAEEGANLEEAAADCQHAIRLNPSRRAFYLDTLAAVRLRQGDTQAAIAALESALVNTTEHDATLRETIHRRLAAARAQLN